MSRKNQEEPKKKHIIRLVLIGRMLLNGKTPIAYPKNNTIPQHQMNRFIQKTARAFNAGDESGLIQCFWGMYELILDETEDRDEILEKELKAFINLNLSSHITYHAVEEVWGSIQIITGKIENCFDKEFITVDDVDSVIEMDQTIRQQYNCIKGDAFITKRILWEYLNFLGCITTNSENTKAVRYDRVCFTEKLAKDLRDPLKKFYDEIQLTGEDTVPLLVKF